MSKTKIFTYVLLIPILILGYLLYDGIRGPILEQRRIAGIEARVIEKLKLLRNIQAGYYSVNGKYAGSWSELTNFINNGKFLNIQRKEIVDSINAQGVESVRVIIDTLGTTPVRDSLFPASTYPDFDPNTLSVIPGSGGKQFEIYAGTIDRNNIKVNVFEIKDTAPVNPERRKNKNEKALKVGSREEATIAGNWED
ncbi:hypothetical protein GXP67_22410 [Rhodocytophaga rosea]|uniref:Uncharacterized protein n=1 Tax=Rhodocytophaga rosea TaxID=2704465 RepID=A0A6C0GMD5_9BACT|nr:hypothetical protein [Rhodocytophaga rosea]QHT69198.1 hypothetical protein GXP67_22410 [Rhodocytophaga rosea]